MNNPLHCSLISLPSDRSGEKYAVYLDNAYAGGITVHSIDRARGVFSYGIAIAPHMRRQGAARAALTQLLSFYASRGFTHCVVEVYANNVPSLALHTSLGFLPAARLTQEGRETLRLEKSLAPCESGASQ